MKTFLIQKFILKKTALKQKYYIATCTSETVDYFTLLYSIHLYLTSKYHDLSVVKISSLRSIILNDGTSKYDLKHNSVSTFESSNECR